MPGSVPIFYSSLISKTFVCSSLLLPNRKKMCLHCFLWQKGSSSRSTGFLRLSWNQEMGHRAWSFVKHLLFSASYWSKNLSHSLWHLTSNLKAQSVPGKRGLLLAFNSELHKHSGFWGGCWMVRDSSLPPRNCRLRTKAKALSLYLMVLPLARTPSSFIPHDRVALIRSWLMGWPIARLHSYEDEADSLYSNQAFAQKNHQILFSLILPASCACSLLNTSWLWN